MPITINGTGPIDGITSLNTSVSSTELGFLDGVTSALQTQINTAGGLVKITDSSFSAQSSVSINNCFTSTYENYRVILYSDSSSSTGIALNMRLRASGSDNSTTNYYLGSKGRVSTGSDIDIAQSATTSFQLSWIAGAGAYNVSMDITTPQSSSNRTNICGNAVGLGGSGSQSYASGAFAGAFATTTSFDGLTVFPASGTITGKIIVYGYRN